jgi:hypothetical protein
LIACRRGDDAEPVLVFRPFLLGEDLGSRSERLSEVALAKYVLAVGRPVAVAGQA